jgi:CheY-like chemotaxis protein
MAYSIIKKHDGLITVESEVGKGSTFHILLPASDNTLTPEIETEEKKELFTGEGRILLMDDEEFVRRIAKELLQHLGFTVETAKDGDEVIALYRKYLQDKDHYTAVIMDLTIPGSMGAREAILRLRELDPQVKAIVSSGYANDPILTNYREYGFDGRVSKPFKLEELAETLEQVLGRNA